NQPTKVTLFVSVNYIELVKETRNDLYLDVLMYFEQLWNDPRLKFYNRQLNTIIGGEDIKRLIWVPDTFISNAFNVRAHNVPSPQMFVKINSSGDVWLTVSIKCSQELSSFPCDKQRCHMRFESYAHNANTIIHNLTAIHENGPNVIPNFKIRDYAVENKITQFESGKV
ncbi:glycine receptor subunit alpha 3-like 213, partial [Dinothrombium tinctorium]